MRVRRYQVGEEEQIWKIFFHTIRNINIRDYSKAQVRAWAPDDPDLDRWRNRIRELNPFVAENGQQICGYADIQADGYIDHFYCHHQWQRRGVGSLLMRTLLQEVDPMQLSELYANVSITARPFFESRGFVVEAQQTVTVGDQPFTNYRMKKPL